MRLFSSQKEKWFFWIVFKIEYWILNIEHICPPPGSCRNAKWPSRNRVNKPKRANLGWPNFKWPNWDDTTWVYPRGWLHLGWTLLEWLTLGDLIGITEVTHFGSPTVCHKLGVTPLGVAPVWMTPIGVTWSTLLA